MESNYIVRAANPEEAALLAEFMTLQAMETEGKTLEQEKITNGVKGIFERPHCGKYYVAVFKDSESVAGMIMIHFEMNLYLGGFIHWINSVYVHPDHRQVGVFRLMYNHVVAVAKSQAPLVKCVRLYVDLDNKVA